MPSRDIRQPDGGYRYAVDPFLLADFTPKAPVERMLDIGTGSGVLPALLEKFFPHARMVGIDIRHTPLTHAAANAPEATFIQADARTLPYLFKPESFDLAVSNPPYRKKGSGRISADPDKAVARHELKLTFPQLAAGAAAVLKPGGRFCLCHLYERRDELMHTLARAGLNPARLRPVRSYEKDSPFLILIEAVKGETGAPLQEPPLTLYRYGTERGRGEYSDEMKTIYQRLELPKGTWTDR